MVLRRFLLAVFAVALIAPAPVHAQTIIDPEPEMPEPAQPGEDAIQTPTDDVPLIDDDRQARLDELFDRLGKTADPRIAKPIADSIWSQWFRSGSASIDLMMRWSNAAMADRRYAMALDFLDQVVIRAPDYAEGWNRRATLHFTMDNYAKSMNDIERVLALEPRHFGALSGMATILEQSGNKRAALAAWQRTLEVYPAMQSAQDAVVRLSDDLAGDPV